MKKSFPIQMLQDGGEVDPQQQQMQRRKRAIELQRIAPQFLPGVPLGMKPKKKKPQDPLQPLAPQPQQGMQRGGKVKARGTDTVPIMATPGEFVLNRGAVAAAGKPFLNYLNQIGKSSPAMMQGGGAIEKDKKDLFPVQYRQTGGPALGTQPTFFHSGNVSNPGPFGFRNWATGFRRIPYVALGEKALGGADWVGNQINKMGANKGGGGGFGEAQNLAASGFGFGGSQNIPISNQGVPVGGDNIPVMPPVIVQNPDTRPGQAAWNQRWAANEARAPLLSTAISGGGSGSALSGIGQYFEGATAPSALSGYGALFGGAGGGGMGPPSVSHYLQGGGEVTPTVSTGYVAAPVTPTKDYPYPTDQEYHDAMLAAFRSGRLAGRKAVPSADVFADTQDAMLQHPGIMELPTMDFDNTGNFSTGTYEMDGKTYILPTMPGWSQKQAVDRFKTTGEHMGVFESDQSANAFDQQFINLRSEKGPPPAGYQSGGMVRGTGVSPFAPRAAVPAPAASPWAGILRGVSNALTQNRLRQQHFAHLARSSFHPNFQSQQQRPKSRRASPFSPTQR